VLGQLGLDLAGRWTWGSGEGHGSEPNDTP
jgi:hypothetical protein